MKNKNKIQKIYYKNQMLFNFCTFQIDSSTYIPHKTHFFKQPLKLLENCLQTAPSCDENYKVKKLTNNFFHFYGGGMRCNEFLVKTVNALNAMRCVIKIFSNFDRN